ncbi:hypothetical protein HF086_012892 [Spodoptera exigua]|uniref:SCP domain-containing protein n=1 Tax=Spodoptera exigua TaxID=7107 RepID=A0A922MVI6_SPOEX|nr:hypothetical protein HF086_012892 [Spodoptera exigua]
MLGVVVVLSGVLALTAARSVNYCGARMCGNTDNHTFCQYSEGPSDKCEGYLYARLGSNEKKRILDRINGFRRDAAAGIMKGFPPAANMMKMHWVEELAREAQRWADQCRPPQPVEERDTCRDLCDSDRELKEALDFRERDFVPKKRIQKKKGPSAKCEGYIGSKLGSQEKRRILARFNSLRADAAFGVIMGYPPATNMLKMHWVEELARLAQRWADQCRPPKPIEEHDTCRDLYSVKVGQCVASVVGQRPTRVEQMLDIWYLQNLIYNSSVDYYVPPRNDSGYYGDFAQMFWAKSYMVGCARSRFLAPWKGRLERVERLVCNIAPAGPQVSRSIWTPGPPGSSCPPRAQLSYTTRGLCDYSESVREMQEALYRKERELSNKGKHRRKKVRRGMPNFWDEEPTTRGYKRFLTTQSKSVNPFMAIIKLIPSMADYPENTPMEVIAANTASHVTPSLVTVLLLSLKLHVYHDGMLGVVVVLSGVLALAAASSVNYCGARMCGNTDEHTFCQYPVWVEELAREAQRWADQCLPPRPIEEHDACRDLSETVGELQETLLRNERVLSRKKGKRRKKGPSPKCVGYENVKLRSREKLRILKRLNSGRNKAAAGGLPGFPPAGNMMKLHWVEELARLAQRWADQCRPPNPIEEHDTCRDLYSLTVGQCVASVISDRPVRVDLMIDVWNRQSKYYNHSITSYVPPSNGSRYYGDFAQLYWAKSYMVGCAHSQFQAPWKGVLRKVDRLVCNLAPAGPQLHRRIWNPSAPTELCPYRGSRSSTWFNLCDYR